VPVDRACPGPVSSSITFFCRCNASERDNYCLPCHLLFPCPLNRAYAILIAFGNSASLGRDRAVPGLVRRRAAQFFTRHIAPFFVTGRPHGLKYTRGRYRAVRSNAKLQLGRSKKLRNHRPDLVHLGYGGRSCSAVTTRWHGAISAVIARIHIRLVCTGGLGAQTPVQKPHSSRNQARSEDRSRVLTSPSNL
jgi:hypothetical protein